MCGVKSTCALWLMIVLSDPTVGQNQTSMTSAVHDTVNKYIADVFLLVSQKKDNKQRCRTFSLSVVYEPTPSLSVPHKTFDQGTVQIYN